MLLMSTQVVNVVKAEPPLNRVRLPPRTQLPLTAKFALCERSLLVHSKIALIDEDFQGWLKGSVGRVRQDRLLLRGLLVTAHL